MSMKNSNDTIGNRNRDLPVCTAVPELTAPPRPHVFSTYNNKIVVWTTLLFDINIYLRVYIPTRALLSF
jgi:hypothetical protein